MKSYQETLADIGHQLADRAAADQALIEAESQAAARFQRRRDSR